MKTKSQPKQLAKANYRAGKRKCSRCKELFYKERGELSRICSRCKEHCVRCDVLLTEDNTSKAAQRRNTYYCRKCKAEIVKLSQKNSNWKQRDYDLLRNYGITVNEYEEMLKDQEGVCWICKSPPKKVRLSVDHKHEAGEKRRNVREIRKRVRGLLCWHCNVAIAKFKDNPEALRMAANYLEVLPAQKTLRKGKNA